MQLKHFHRSSSSTSIDVMNDDYYSKPISIKQSSESVALSLSHLSHSELLKRRYDNLKLLSKCYRDLYWALLEKIKTHYRDYLWEYGVTPYKEDNDVSENKNKSTELDQFESPMCAFVGCDSKAMPLTTFCNLHILSDPNQKLYKPCNYVIKCAEAEPIRCGKPILRSSVPSLCTAHFQKAQKHISTTLKKTRMKVSSTSKMAPKLHIIVTEYIRHIQMKRRKELSRTKK
ncbi:putative DNA-binding domain, KAT8 regulatory NSL complex subunit 2 [Lupinus albus]|uniref:KAT8 regulatory NSL complex subunit 2 n=1 Tax=Lupinus albus TaxID=3870 RepID=A0A6A4N4T8_LUPAL|nr:putative DNA-binding domain, KAT8 regulatory NSL complex subunit 2 [Lupinus albus]